VSLPPPNASVLTVAAPRADEARLQALARKHAGATVELTEAASLPAVALSKLVRAALRGGARDVVVEVRADEDPAGGLAVWVRGLRGAALGLVTGDLAATGLVSALRAATAAGVPCLVTLAVDEASLEALTRPVLDALCAAAGLDRLTLRLRPSADGPGRLDVLCERIEALADGPHEVRLVDLWPACALPARAVVTRARSSEAAALGSVFAAACEGCALRAGARCRGLPPAWLARHERDVGPFAGPMFRHQAENMPFGVDPNALELRGLVIGLRRVWRADVDAAQLAPLLRVFERARLGEGPLAGLRLVALPSGPIEMGLGGLAVPCEAKPGARHLVLVAQEVADARAALALETEAQPASRAAEMEGAARVHRALGALYGYPPCCVEAFVDGHRERFFGDARDMAENAFHALRAARRSRRFDARLNTLAVDDEATLLRHFPCRFDCEPSIALAERLEADLARSNPTLLARHRALRRAPVVLWADGRVLCLDGLATSETRVERPRTRAVSGQSLRSASARDLEVRLAPQLDGAIALEGQGLAGPGGVRIAGALPALSTPLVLPDAPPHPLFPRLFVPADPGGPPIPEELRLILAGLRLACRFDATPAQSADLTGTAGVLGLAVRVDDTPLESPRPGVLREDPTGLGSGRLLVVVARDEALATAVLAHERALLRPRSREVACVEDAAHHRALGALYGYPDCCVAHFCAIATRAVSDQAERRSGNFLVIASALARTRSQGPFDARLDVFDAGVSPLRHLPCAWDCRESVALARRAEEVLNRHSVRDAVIFVKEDGMLVRAAGPSDARGLRLVFTFVP